LPEFAAALANWEWDVALLQEVPPWWPEVLARRAGATQRLVLTSRNALLPVRRAIAVRWPELIKSGGGGANAILVRPTGVAFELADHRTLRLALWPERRQLQAVGLVVSGRQLWVGNLHATVHDDARARREADAARAAMVRWSGGAPFVLGGDFNVRKLRLAGLARAGGHDVDHVFVSGLEPMGPPEVLDRGRLSDHAPVVVALRL
jgi:endonuclease/exonuclease/phosphatase family metal-dependent hydrolase